MIGEWQVYRGREETEGADTYKRHIRPQGKQKMAVRIPQMPYFLLGSWLPAAHMFITTPYKPR